MSRVTHHCCVIAVDGFGILVEGPSGSGKTSLMFGLHERLSQMGISVKLVSDDRACIEVRSDQVIARAPETIRGKAEIRGYGIIPINCSTKPVAIGLIVRLVEDQEIQRMRDPRTINFHSCPIELLEVPTRHEEGATRIILAWLRDNTDIALHCPGS